MQKITRLKKFIDWQNFEHRKNKSVENTYDRLSENSDYDNVINFEQRTADLKKLTTGLDLKNKKILDLACGSGAFLNTVLEKNPQEIIGVDLSAGMLKLARERFRNSKNVKFINKSFVEVSFPKESFDLILLANASRYIPAGREKIFFENVSRWLKNGGTFIIHSDFFYGIVGRLLAPVIVLLSHKSNLNPKTTFDWNLEVELRKYFSIKKKMNIGINIFGRGHHTAFFCVKLNK